MLAVLDPLSLFAIAAAGSVCFVFLTLYAIRYGRWWEIHDPAWRYIVALNLSVVFVAFCSVLIRLVDVPVLHYLRAFGVFAFACTMAYQVVLLYKDSDA